MSSRTVILAGLAALLAAGALRAQPWSGPAGLEVRATSRSGPVAGAVVRLSYRSETLATGPAPVATDGNGRATLTGLAGGTWQVEVSHPDYMTFVAVVELGAQSKPEVTASFLEATDASTTSLRVKIGKARGPASPPLPVADRAVPETSESPVGTAPRAPAPRAPSAQPAAPEPPQPEAPAPPEAASAPPPESDESASPPMAQPAAPPSAPEPASEAAPAPVPPQPPAPEPPAATPPQAAPPEPPAAAPPEATPPEPPAAAPPEATPPEPPETAVPAAEPGPEATSPSAPTAPPVPTGSAPAPEAPPVAAAPGMQTPGTISFPTAEPVRAYSRRTCVECRPGEWAAVERVTSSGGDACAREDLDGLDAVMDEIAETDTLELRSYAGPLAGARELLDAGTLERLDSALSALPAGCRIAAVVLPRNARFSAFQYEASAGAPPTPCLPDRPCEGVAARWHGPPHLRRGANATLAFGLFQSEADAAGYLTVYFRAANPGWEPGADR